MSKLEELNRKEVIKKMTKRCKNCGFKFENGDKIATRGANHPDAYCNPNNPIGLKHTPYISEICPRCKSDAIKEF